MLHIAGEWERWSPWTECEGEVSVQPFRQSPKTLSIPSFCKQLIGGEAKGEKLHEASMQWRLKTELQLFTW